MQIRYLQIFFISIALSLLFSVSFTKTLKNSHHHRHRSSLERKDKNELDKKINLKESECDEESLLETLRNKLSFISLKTKTNKVAKIESKAQTSSKANSNSRKNLKANSELKTDTNMETHSETQSELGNNSGARETLETNEKEKSSSEVNANATSQTNVKTENNLANLMNTDVDVIPSEDDIKEKPISDEKKCHKIFPHITVYGVAKTSLKTDLIHIGLQIDTKRSNAQEALQINTQTSNIVTTALTSNGVSNTDISTVNFSLRPQYVWVRDPNIKETSIRKFDGFLVSNVIDIKTTKINLAGKIIDLAVENGANTINYVNFEILPETLEKTKTALIKDAISDALIKAKIVLEPLGYETYEINSVILNENTPIFQGKNERAISASFNGDLSPNIFNNEKVVSANIKVVFLIRKNEQ